MDWDGHGIVIQGRAGDFWSSTLPVNASTARVLDCRSLEREHKIRRGHFKAGNVTREHSDREN